MDKSRFSEKNSSDEKKKFLVKGLLRKMAENNLSPKESSLVRQLKKSSAAQGAKKKLSTRQLNRAVKRNRQAILQKRNGAAPNRRNRGIHAPFIIGTVAASVLILLVFSLYNTLQPSQNPSGHDIVQNDKLDHRFSTEKNMKRITLADGSTVFLNRGTSISLRKGKFNAHTREVWLEEGEAFFEVAKDPSRPFIVHTLNGISTRVLGTSFNIKSYSDLSDQVISVNSGRVQVINQSLEKIVLDPNYKVSVSNDDGLFTSGEADARAISAWRTGKIVLDNASISEVAFRIQQYYDVEVVYDTSEFKNDRIFTSFTLETPIEEVTSVIGKLTNASFRIENTKILLYK